MKKRMIVLILMLALFTGAFYIVKSYNKPKVVKTDEVNTTDSILKFDSSNYKETTEAPDFTLQDLNGKKVSLKDLKGKKVYLNFGATWCPPCRLEMPDIEKLYQETKDSDLVIIGIDIGEDKETVKNFISKNNYNFKILLDSDQSVASKYNITAIPASFFIDKNGKIVSSHIGAMTLEQMKENVKLLN